MAVWYALLRGVNVGGGNKLPMADLRRIAGTLGWAQAKTYIASGNLVFEADATAEGLSDALQGALRTELGLEVAVLVLSHAALAQARAACPYAPDDPRHVHIHFLLGPPAIDTALLDARKAPSEDLTLGSNVAYLFAPDGIGRSKLAESLPRVLGCASTARNLRTVDSLLAMAPPA